MKIQKVYLVKYLFPKEETSCMSIFLRDYFKPYEERKKYFRTREDAKHFLGLVKGQFQTELPDLKFLCCKKNFCVKTSFQLARRNK